MKAIQPISVWTDGQQQTANQFNLIIVSDNLENSATFTYELINQTNSVNTVLARGSSFLSGQDYADWNGNPDINDDAYARIAAKLNITLIS